MSKEPAKRKLSDKVEEKAKKVKLNNQIHPDREKGINLFKNVFLQDYKKEDIDEDFENHIVDLSYQIESEIYKKYNENIQNQKYKENIRQIFINLKDKNNPQIRLKIVSKQLTPEQLITCDPKEFLSEEHKQQYNKLLTDQLQSRNSDWLNTFKLKNSVASLNVCVRCKSKNIDTRLQQTRSADEPMTEFHTCLDCGRQWKC